jgi:hypothetical protein
MQQHDRPTDKYQTCIDYLNSSGIQPVEIAATSVLVLVLFGLESMTDDV